MCPNPIRELLCGLGGGGGGGVCPRHEWPRHRGLASGAGGRATAEPLHSHQEADSSGGGLQMAVRVQASSWQHLPEGGWATTGVSYGGKCTVTSSENLPLFGGYLYNTMHG